MSGEDHGQKGQSGALTPPISEDFPTAAEIAKALDVMAALPRDDHQPGLFADSLETVAEISNSHRRARGRPAGSGNRRNEELFDYLDSLGFKNPVVRLMEIISAEHGMLCSDRIEALKLQIRAAEALLPYMLAKKPQQLKIDKETLHVFMAGPMLMPGQGRTETFNLGEQYQEVTTDATGPVAPDAVAQSDNAVQDQAVDPVKPAV